jgi:hypothetical protein
LNFISHNTETTQAFVEALSIYRLKGSKSQPTAIDAIGFERVWQGGPMCYLYYQAIVTINAQNNLSCFDDLDMPILIGKMHQMSAPRRRIIDHVP